jgi:hypothetical protein
MAALADKDAPMAAEAGAARAGILPQEIRIDFCDASVSALDDLVEAGVDTRQAGFDRGQSRFYAIHAAFDAVEARLAAPRARYHELLADTAMLDAVLTDGASRARRVATEVLGRCRAATGMRSSPRRFIG